jgi:threonine synthase
MLECLRDSRGTAIAIGEDELMAGTELMARKRGIHCSPEGGACVAAAKQLRKSGFLKREDAVVLFNTGHALKYAN